MADDSVLVEVVSTNLDLLKYVNFVTDPSAGATASFIGSTRNSFGGKTVLKLEYEAYIPMAEKKMMELCATLRTKWQVAKIAIAHRVGEVKVTEASVIIAISSTHRRDSLEAAHWAIDELKATIPIWKKEHYEDGSIWKENAESRAVHGTTPSS